MRYLTCVLCAIAVLPGTSPAASGLFSENFNTDTAGSWTVNPVGGTDHATDFYYDYSTVGIPEAPNSQAGDSPTRGMQFRVNETSNLYGGVTASPTGLDLGGGDFTMTFDWWENVVGPLPNLGSGLTQFGLAGVLTSGTAVNGLTQPTTDAVYFAATGDGGSASDWRAFSPDAVSSYAPDDQTNGVDVYAAPNEFTPPANNRRNGSNAYYSQFGNIAPPALQQTLFPGSQTGELWSGAPGYAWREVTIAKTGSVVRWSVDGLAIAQVDTADLVTQTGGGNILFGRHDVNFGSSSDPNAPLLSFTLIDNIVVVPEPATFALAGLAASGLLLRRRQA